MDLEKVGELNNDVTIVIPTYNESENLPELVSRIRAVCNDVYILIVDDSPNMDTANLATKLGCIVNHHAVKKGLSASIIEGIQYASTDKVIVMDADLQHPPEVLPDIIKALDSNELVIASRWVKGGGVRDWSLKRVITSKVANLLAFPLVPKILDRTSGFFGVQTKCLDTSELNPIGWKTSLEVMVKGNYKSFKEVPFVFENRKHGESKLSSKIITEYCSQLKDLYLRNKFLKFIMVGSSGAVIKLLSMFLLTNYGHVFYMLSYLISSILAITSNYTLNSLWTFDQFLNVSFKSHVFKYLRYVATSCIAVAINELILFILTGKLHVWYMFSAFIGIFTAFAVNYILSRRIVWKQHPLNTPKIAHWQ